MVWHVYLHLGELACNVHSAYPSKCLSDNDGAPVLIDSRHTARSARGHMPKRP